MPQANRGGGSSAPTNHNNSNLSTYHHSPTPPQQHSLFVAPMQRFGGSSSSSQMQLNFGASTQQQQQEQQHTTFNHQFNQQLPIGQGGGDQSFEFALRKLRAVNPNAVPQFLQVNQNTPGLDSLCVAIHFAPDPIKAGEGEKRHSLFKASGIYISDDGWKYDCRSENNDLTFNYQPDTTKQPSTYTQVFHVGGEKLKSLMKHYNKDIRYSAKNGYEYDLRKLYDPSGGVTIEYTPIKNGPTYIVGWDNMQGQEMRLAGNNPARRGNQIARMCACRANILRFCEEKGLPLLVRVFFLVCSNVLVSIISHITNPLLSASSVTSAASSSTLQSVPSGC